MKVEFHIHSDASKESNNSVSKIIEAAKKNKINCLIICDHDTISGAKILQKETSIKIVAGEEISSKSGEIIGLFLNKKISSGLSLKKTISEIKKQGGLVCVPHPCDGLRRKAIDQIELKKNIEQVDLIEIFNARSLFRKCNQAADEMAKLYRKAEIVGSDAHTPSELGDTYLEMKTFKNPTEFMKNIKTAKFTVKTAKPTVHLITAFKKIHKKIYPVEFR